MKQQHGQGADSLANIFNILEQQSQFLKRLQDTVSRIKESLLPGDHKPSSQEFFTAILTGQYAILSKFDEVASIRLNNTDDFHPATAALQDAEDAANVRAHATKEQYQQIEALRMKVEKTTVHDVELRAEVAVLEQRLKDIRQERDELRSSLKDKESRLEGAMKKETRTGEEMDRLMTRVLAAELERDVLARSLTELREEREKTSRGKERKPYVR